MNHSCHYASKQ